MTNNYLENHIKSALKVGDIVIITRTAVSYGLGWNNTWNEEMNNFINSEHKIFLDGKTEGFQLDCMSIDGEYFYFPYFVLEKINILTKDEIDNINDLINEFNNLI